MFSGAIFLGLPGNTIGTLHLWSLFIRIENKEAWASRPLEILMVEVAMWKASQGDL